MASTLIHWWLEHRQRWNQEQKQVAFNKIMASNALRSHRMDPIYLALYAMRTPWMANQAYITSDTFQQALLNQHLGTEQLARATATSSSLTVKVAKRVLSAVQSKGVICCFMGFSLGFPLFLRIEKPLQRGCTLIHFETPHTMGLYVGCSTGGSPSIKRDGQEIKAGLALQVSV